MTRKKKVPPEVQLNNETTEVAKYILQKAGNDNKVPVALLAIATLEVHRYMAFVLAPMCPNAYMAQVKTLRQVLYRVLDYLHDNTYNQEARAYFTNLVLARLNHFIEFLSYCYGTSTKIVVVNGGDGYVLHGLHTVISEVVEPVINFEDLRPEKEVSLRAPYVRFIKRYFRDLGEEVFKDIYSKLFDYINQKTNGDAKLPMLVLAYSYAHLYDSLNMVLPQDCKEAYYAETHWSLPPIKDLHDSIMALLWFKSFIEHVAWCYGIDLELRAEPKPDGVEVTEVLYTYPPKS